jgi:hypothetical protein
LDEDHGVETAKSFDESRNTELMTHNLGFIWRGALGGILGAPLASIGLMIQEYARLGYVPYSGFLEIMTIPVFVVVGLVLGSAIGLILCLLVSWLGAARFHFLVRAIVGAIFVLAAMLVFRLLRDGGNNGFAPPTAMELFVQIVIYTTTFGILPAIFARPINEEEKLA